MDIIREYKPSGPTLKRFHESNSFVRGLMGPFGSGKSSACVAEILLRSFAQKPSPDGLRRTRWVVIRNTYAELKSTAIKTWGQWIPTSFGKLNQDSPITHRITNAQMDMEVLFLALDSDEDVRKLLSLELTGAWVNEAREVPKAILDALTGRVGRYPSRMDGGPTWSGIVMDTNPPDDQSWWYRLSEDERPEGWQFFKQPPGDSPEAENVQNLPPGYYQRMREGKDPDWIKVYIQGAYGLVTEGKAVFPSYRDRIHANAEAVEPYPAFGLLLGADFGLTPACIIGQKLPDGRWVIIDELVTDNCGIVRFAETLASYVATHYPAFQISGAWGDPAGMARMGESERTAIDLMTEYTGWKWRPAPSNDPVMRAEVVNLALSRLIDGNPGILISPRCKVLRKALAGGYHYKPVRSGNNQQFHSEPAKNEFSHPAEALEYLLLGGGEAHVVMNRVGRNRTRRSFQASGTEDNPFENRRDGYDPFNSGD